MTTLSFPLSSLCLLLYTVSTDSLFSSRFLLSTNQTRDTVVVLPGTFERILLTSNRFVHSPYDLARFNFLLASHILSTRENIIKAGWIGYSIQQFMRICNGVESRFPCSWWNGASASVFFNTDDWVYVEQVDVRLNIVRLARASCCALTFWRLGTQPLLVPNWRTFNKRFSHMSTESILFQLTFNFIKCSRYIWTLFYIKM